MYNVKKTKKYHPFNFENFLLNYLENLSLNILTLDPCIKNKSNVNLVSTVFRKNITKNNIGTYYCFFNN